MSNVRRRALALLVLFTHLRYGPGVRAPSKQSIKKKKRTRMRGLHADLSCIDLNSKPAKRKAALNARELITVAVEETRINKRLYGRRIRVRRAEQPEQMPDDVARDYEVEKVLAERGVGEDKAYLVKWVGYADPSWEPAANLDTCDERIDDFDPGFVELNSGSE
ncbi:hypothetical protein AAVH_23483 [Aphelenchoides avenae]|nr:hypothetical protein AAVH_23483 [Aphelenchus avenae]